MKLSPEISEKLLFLHGIACTRKVWEPILPLLPDNIGVLALDLRFHGQSRIPTEPEPFACSMQAFGQDLIETLSETGFHPVWLVGHSMGARAAVAATILHPELVRGLVLVDHPLYVSNGDFRVHFGNFLEELPSHFPSQDLAMDYLRKTCPDPASISILSSSIVQNSNGGVEFDFDKTNVLRTFHSLPTSPFTDWLHLLGEQGKPVLVFRGARSSFWSKEDWEQSQRSFGQHRSFKFLEIDSAGHGVPFERPQVFLEELLNFIQRESA